MHFLHSYLFPNHSLVLKLFDICTKLCRVSSYYSATFTFLFQLRLDVSSLADLYYTGCCIHLSPESGSSGIARVHSLQKAFFYFPMTFDTRKIIYFCSLHSTTLLFALRSSFNLFLKLERRILTDRCDTSSMKSW